MGGARNQGQSCTTCRRAFCHQCADKAVADCASAFALSTSHDECPGPAPAPAPVPPPAPAPDDPAPPSFKTSLFKKCYGLKDPEMSKPSKPGSSEDPAVKKLFDTLHSFLKEYAAHKGKPEFAGTELFTTLQGEVTRAVENPEWKATLVASNPSAKNERGAVDLHCRRWPSEGVL